MDRKEEAQIAVGSSSTESFLRWDNTGGTTLWSIFVFEYQCQSWYLLLPVSL